MTPGEMAAGPTLTLPRNMGSSIGIALLQLLLTRNTQGTSARLVALNALVTQQAALTACTVGPDFHAPAAPDVTTYTSSSPATSCSS